MQDEEVPTNNHLCPECGKGFKKRSKLVIHIRSHTGEKPFLCEVCGKGFSSTYALTAHKKIHTGEKPHTCNICGRSFTDKCTLRRHILRHIGERNYICKICNKGYTTDSALASHVKWHSAENSFFCEVCGKGFLLKSTLTRHVSTVHMQTKPHACMACDKRFAHRCSLLDHLRTHIKPFACTICTKTFTFEKYLEKHLEKHRSMSSANTEDEKELAFKLKAEEKQEDSLDPDEIDPSQETHVCHICDKKLKTKGFLARHLKTHEPKSVRCPVCHKSFQSQKRVKLHIERFHASIPSPDLSPDIDSVNNAVYVKEETGLESDESIPMEHELTDFERKIYQEIESLKLKVGRKPSPIPERRVHQEIEFLEIKVEPQAFPIVQDTESECISRASGYFVSSEEVDDFCHGSEGEADIDPLI